MHGLFLLPPRLLCSYTKASPGLDWVAHLIQRLAAEGGFRSSSLPAEMRKLRSACTAAALQLRRWLDTMLVASLCSSSSAEMAACMAATYPRPAPPSWSHPSAACWQREKGTAAVAQRQVGDTCRCGRVRSCGMMHGMLGSHAPRVQLPPLLLSCHGCTACLHCIGNNAGTDQGMSMYHPIETRQLRQLPLSTLPYRRRAALGLRLHRAPGRAWRHGGGAG